MNKRLACFMLVGVLVMVGLTAVLLAMAGMWVLRHRQDQSRVEFAPPTVIITSPVDGVAVGAGSFLPIRATISFLPEAPVRDLEWWLDGSPLESEAIQTPAGATRFFADLDLLVPAPGGHLLSLRAINTRGVIGQSLPLFIEGVEKPQGAYSVRLNEGDTLESVAAAFGSDAATLQGLNPSLGGAAPQPGASIAVPIPPETGPEPPLASPAPPGAIAALIPTTPMLQPAKMLSGVAGMLAVMPPKAASNLRAEVQDCKVKLVWDDVASNESGYQIWQTSPGGAPILRATLQASPGGATWYEVDATGPGIFGYFVVAYNAGGTQPSSLVLVNIDAKCPSASATHLGVELRDIHFGVPSDRVYCYVSFENAPETRLPAKNGDFITVTATHGDLGPWPHTFAVPLPQDGGLDLSGECWGWAGSALSKLGTFSATLASDAWDGKDRVLSGGAFDITLGLQPQGPSGPGNVNYTTGPTLPIPYDVQEKELDQGPRIRELSWKWDGNRDELDDFVILLNGSPITYVGFFPLEGYKWTVSIDRGCGQDLYWQVAAKSGTMVSGLSAPRKVEVAPCKTVVRVRYDAIELECTAEGSSSCMTDGAAPWSLCDTLDAYYELSVNDETRSFWGGTSFIPVSCGRYAFSDLGSLYTANQIYTSSDSFILPVDAGPIDLRIRASFWDHDGWPNGDDLIASDSRDLWFPSLESARSNLGVDDQANHCLWTSDESWEQNGTARANVVYTVELFPNACLDSP